MGLLAVFLRGAGGGGGRGGGLGGQGGGGGWVRMKLYHNHSIAHVAQLRAVVEVQVRQSSAAAQCAHVAQLLAAVEVESLQSSCSVLAHSGFPKHRQAR